MLNRRKFLSAVGAGAASILGMGAVAAPKYAEGPPSALEIPQFFRFEFQKLTIPRDEYMLRHFGRIADGINRPKEMRADDDNWSGTNADYLARHLTYSTHAITTAKPSLHDGCYVQHVLALEESGENYIYHRCEIVATEAYALELNRRYGSDESHISLAFLRNNLSLSHNRQPVHLWGRPIEWFEGKVDYLRGL